MRNKNWIFRFIFVMALLWAPAALPVCMNKYVFRTQEMSKQVLTILTGKLTFQEAQELAKAIRERKAVPLEWVESNGKSIAKLFGELKVVRPMPVGCDDKTSGVVVTATFLTVMKPSGRIYLKLDGTNAVPFDQQKE